MDIKLYINNSEKEAIYKTLTNEIVFSGYLREESSIITPSFIIETSNPSSYNYCYIPAFNRYYFITDIVSVRTNLWRIQCSVDVLMSFQDEILNLDVTVESMTDGDDSRYMVGDVWKTMVKTKTDVINFPSGLLDDGEYILITSGGIAT